jgi:hypothetical protein
MAGAHTFGAYAAVTEMVVFGSLVSRFGSNFFVCCF